MKRVKIVKTLFIISIILSILFLVLFFILRAQAAACDPVWEIKRHDALLVAAYRFIYMFFVTFVIAAATGVTLITLKYQNNKTKVNETKVREEIKKYDNIQRLMVENNIGFFYAVWEYFISVGAIERFKESYISQLQFLNIDEKIAETNLTLTDKQKEIVKSELDTKIADIKEGKYNKVFESVFKDEVKTEIEMSDNNAVGGMSPDEYLNLLFDSSNGAMFFFAISIDIENDVPIVKLDIDDGEIDWQPFD
ncbi:MAG: hypothetical protein K2M47_03305 [Clostridiales bacterium]|nr:hypothetical protein [Clostridiales bacterium]